MKQRVSYFVIGLFVGLIVGFTVTNHLNRPEFAPGRKGAAPGQAGPVQGTPMQQTGQGGQPDDPHAQLTDEQIASAKAKVDADPDNYQNQLMFAQALYSIRQQPKEAVPYFERAHDLKPNEVDPLMGLANAYFDIAQASNYDAKTFEKSAEYYEKALAINPKNVNARTDLGLTYFYRNPPDVDRAIENYKKSLEIEPNHAITLGNYATALMAKGDAAGAEAMIARLEASNPGHPMLANLRGNLDKVKQGERIPTH